MFGLSSAELEQLEGCIISHQHGWKTLLVTSNIPRASSSSSRAGENAVSEPVRLKFSPDTTFQAFLDTTGPRINVVPARRAFNEAGEEIFDFEQLLDDDIVYISKGENFYRHKNDQTTDVVGGFVVKELLGEGGFGKVMKAVHPETGEIVAIKFINKKSFNEITDADRVFVEIQALRDLCHKHVIKMKDVIDNPTYICFVMEYATHGELRDYVSKRIKLKEDEARHFFEQIIKGVHYCHSKNIVHRDLKLENILLNEENQCKIADFGLSHFVVDNNATVTEGGTQAYLAPEVWNGTSKHSNPFQLDVWALGVILFAMTHGRLPFERPDRSTLEKVKKEGLPFDSTVSPALKKTISAMLHPDPRKRIRISDLMNDPWLRQSLPWEDSKKPQSSSSSSSFHRDYSVGSSAGSNNNISYSSTPLRGASSSASQEMNFLLPSSPPASPPSKSSQQLPKSKEGRKTPIQARPTLEDAIYSSSPPPPSPATNTKLASPSMPSSSYNPSHHSSLPSSLQPIKKEVNSFRSKDDLPPSKTGGDKEDEGRKEGSVGRGGSAYIRSTRTAAAAGAGGGGHSGASSSSHSSSSHPPTTCIGVAGGSHRNLYPSTTNVNYHPTVIHQGGTANTGGEFKASSSLLKGDRDGGGGGGRGYASGNGNKKK